MLRSSKLSLGVLAALLMVATSQAALAVQYGGIGGKPAYPREDNARTESIFIHTLELGQTQAEGVLLLNNTAEEQVIEVYAVDSVGSSDGAFACAQQADPKTDVGNWIFLEKTEVTLAPASQETVPFTITVPAAADTGEHNGCIVIQKKGDSEEAAEGMNLSFRSAMRVAITIPGDIVRSLSIAELTYHAPVAEASPTLTLAVANTGNVSIDAETSIVTHNLFGQTYFDHNGTYPVLRDETAEWHYELPKSFWGGWFQSAATVTYDANTEASLGQDSGFSKTVLDAKTTWFFLPPSPLGAIIELSIVLLLAIVGLITVWLRRSQQQLRATWIKHQVKTGEDLAVLAKQHQVAWKLLAKVNHLKPPYRVVAGDTILVPPTSKQPKSIPSDAQPVAKTAIKSKKDKS